MKMILAREIRENIDWNDERGIRISRLLDTLNQEMNLTTDGIVQTELLKSAQRKINDIWNGGI